MRLESSHEPQRIKSRAAAISIQGANLARTIDSRSSRFRFVCCAQVGGCCVSAAAGHLFFVEPRDDMDESNSVLLTVLGGVGFDNVSGGKTCPSDKTCLGDEVSERRARIQGPN